MNEHPAPPDLEQTRERYERERTERVAARRALLELVPGNLRDLDAAAECECSCHPQPGGDPHHGLRCACQISARARRERWRKTWKSLDSVAKQSRPMREQHERELTEAATELGVQVHEAVAAAPWVLTGVVDGVAWYLRERWDSYEIVVADGDNPRRQPWGAADDSGSTVIRTGTSDDIYQGTPPDYGHALRFVVRQVREHLTRQACAHSARPGDRYCPHCGTALIDLAASR